MSSYMPLCWFPPPCIAITVFVLAMILPSAADRFVLGNNVNTCQISRCNYLPGDSGWPSQNVWMQLNTTVGGRLIATVPLAHVCHQNGTFAAYNKTSCEKLSEDFMDMYQPGTISPVPGEVLNPYWQEETCSPFTAPDTPCELGNRAVYSINVTGPADVLAGLEFATRHNIRLVVRSTGIDYLGKSTAPGALSLYMYSLKSIEVMEKYKSSFYSGPAVKLGAGVISGEASQALNGSGYRIVAPPCGLTGITGGYLQSGGQSQLTTAYGIAADQVLEWEVVTPAGEYIIANPDSNVDLYWALSGGGGGTFGVVLSATIRAFPDGPVAGGQMFAQSSNTTAFWEAIEVWYHQAPSLVEGSTDNIQFVVTNDTLIILCFTLPDQKATDVEILMRNYTSILDRLNITYMFTSSDYPSYLNSYVATYGPLPYGNVCPDYPLISSRIIPRSTVLNTTTNKNLVGLFRDITKDGTWWIGCSILNVDDSPSSVRPTHPPNSVLPAWRDAFGFCNPQTHSPYNWKDAVAQTELRRALAGDFFPRLEAITPGGGVLPELDPTYQGNWKDNFYGVNYDRLLSVKHSYDPHHIMYGLFAVGSDEFTMDEEGRLCRI